MNNFFAGIADTLSIIVEYVVGFFESLIVIISRSVQALGYVVTAVAYLPAYVKVYILAMIGVSAILFVLNKGD